MESNPNRKCKSFKVYGASFGVAPNGIKALEEIHPGTVQKGMIEAGKGIMLPSGSLLLPWKMMRDALLEQVMEGVEDKMIDLRTGPLIEDADEE